MRIGNIGHATLSVQCGNVRLLTDPWLVQRLDRFWEHYPLLGDIPAPKTDVVLLSHHHYDHFHLPSLAKMGKDTIFIFPATQATRAVTGPGGGVFAIPWLLHRLGFTRLKGVQPFEHLKLGSVDIVCLPSAVPFPELSFLVTSGSRQVLIAGDSMLHPDTKRWVQSYEVRPDVALLPVHSTATDACFRNRMESDDVAAKREEAAATFREYVETFSKSAIVPGAFGWRISTVNGHEPACDWMNRRIFPMTITDGYRLASDMGVDVHVWSPGDSIELEASQPLRGDGEHWDDMAFSESICREYALEEPSNPFPPFEPNKMGPSVSAQERQQIIEFVEKEVPQAIRATPFFMQAIERGLRTQLRITGSDELCWLADFKSGSCTMIRSDSEAHDDSVWIDESTFLRLMRAQIPLGHTWGCWIANSPMLDAIFSDPRYFMRYADDLLKTPDWADAYGS